MLDEDSQAKRLVRELEARGIDVATASSHGLAGKDDRAILEAATKEDRAVVTRNCDDFHELHRAGADHVGIILIYRDRRGGSPSYAEIADAIPTIFAYEGGDLKGKDSVGERLPLTNRSRSNGNALSRCRHR